MAIGALYPIALWGLSSLQSPTPILQLFPCFSKAHDPVRIQTLRPEFAVERFYERDPVGRGVLVVRIGHANPTGAVETGHGVLAHASCGAPPDIDLPDAAADRLARLAGQALAPTGAAAAGRGSVRLSGSAPRCPCRR